MKSKIYSLKRISFFFFLLLLPAFSFAGHVKVFSYSADHSTSNVLTFSGVSSDNFVLPFYNNVFGLNVRGVGGSATSVKLLAVPSPSADSLTNRYSNISFPISFSDANIANTTVWNGISYSPALDSLFSFALSVVASGYSDSGLYDLGGNAINHYYNFDYKMVVANILSSTNNVYRALLLNHLSQIQSSVVNIDTGVSSLVPSVDRIADINSSIATNSFDAVSLLRNIDTNFSSAVSSILDVNPRLDSVTNLLDLLHHDNVLGNLDVFLGDDTSSWVGFCNWAYSQGLLSLSERDYFVSEFQSTDASVPPSRSYSIPSSHRRFLAKTSLQGRVVAANQLRGIYQSMGYVPTGSRPWAQEAMSAIGNIFTEGSRAEINYLSGRVEDWRDNLRQQLQDWKTSDEHGILNVKNKIDDVDSAIKKNFEFKPNSFLTNTIPYTAFVTNYVTAPLTNSIDEASGRIVTNASENAQALRDFLHDNLIGPDAEGAAVRIKYPIWGEHESAVHVHDESWDVFGSGLDELNYNVTAVLGDMNSRWSEWFRRWDDFAPPVHSNIEAILKVLLNWTNTTAQLNHVLFYDYSNYVHSASYDDLFSTLENDYPVCYSNLVKFGLSSSADGGRWWNVLASSSTYDTAMLSYVFSDMVELDRIARDNLGESPFSFLQRTLNDMPSKSQIEDYVSQASNATSEVEYALSSFSNSLASVSNSFDSVFNPFRGHFDSPGSSVTFFKIHDGYDGQYVTIPVSDQADAWRYIRLGVSFGLVAVNLLLFPKYLLMLFTLFIKAYRIGIKFFPDDR